MNISASQVMQLRNLTGAGMMDCKAALEEAAGDLDKAADILRKKGVVKAAKRAGKVAAEGLVTSAVESTGKAGALIEVNSETDFVAQSVEFVSFCKELAETALKNKVGDLAALENTKLSSGQTVRDTVNSMTLKIGEKISVRRVALFVSETGQVRSYLHGAKIGVLVEYTGGTPEVATDVAMHIAASRPQCLDRAHVDPADLNREKEIYAEQLRAQNKPTNIVENIVKGKLDKYYSEVCLLEQPFIKDEEITIEQYLKKNGAAIVRYARFELGEGIEKETKDFAAEVAEQLK